MFIVFCDCALVAAQCAQTQKIALTDHSYIYVQLNPKQIPKMTLKIVKKLKMRLILPDSDKTVPTFEHTSENF